MSIILELRCASLRCDMRHKFDLKFILSMVLSNETLVNKIINLVTPKAGP